MKELEDLLDIPESEETQHFEIAVQDFPERQKETTETKEAILDDYNNARENNYTLLKNAQETLKGAIQMANMSPNPRAFEVVTALIKTISELNNDLVTRNKQMKDISNSSVQQAENITNNQINMTLTHDELDKLLKDHDRSTDTDIS